MATFQLFFQSGRAKDLSAPMYLIVLLSEIFSLYNKIFVVMGNVCSIQIFYYPANALNYMNCRIVKNTLKI